VTAHAESRTWTTRTLLAWMVDAFTKKDLDSPRLSAEMLLTHVLGCDRLKLYTDTDRPASPLEREQLRDLVTRALRHEPVQYLVNEKWFFGLPLRVDRRVLIPRPSTETIIESVLLHARAEPGFGGKTGDGVRIADVCTGSGAIAIALLKNLPKATGIATDISADALDVARINLERHGLTGRLETLAGNLLEPLLNHPAGPAGGPLHYLLSNPPYIPDQEWPDVPTNVRDFEPHQALRGGTDGLDFIRPIIDRGPSLLRPGGLILVETAATTAATAAELCRSHALLEPKSVRIAKDFEGHDRVVIAARA
jgi:release factor glutamine methyltransferase